MRIRLLLYLVLALMIPSLSAQNVLEGKKVMWLGTSIPKLGSYPKKACQNLGMTCLNHSVGASFACIREHHAVLYDYSGYSLSMSIAEKEERYRPCVDDGTITESQLNTWKFTSYDRLIFEYIDDIDIIVFDHAYNDYARSVKYEYEAGPDAVDWSSEDRYTFIGAFNYLYRVIREYKPSVKIAIGGYFQDSCSCVPAGQAVAEVSTWIAQHYDIPLIDTWHYTHIPDGHVPDSKNWISEFNARYGTHYHNIFPDEEGNITYFQQFAPDGVHPSCDLSGHSDHVLDSIFTFLLQERLTPLFTDPQPPLQLNEIMPCNVDRVADGHEFPDSWIELYNPGAKELNLKGYFISDQDSLTAAYQFSDNLLIAPYAHPIIYCDRLGEGLHTPFRLQTEGGSLYLWAPDSTLVDSITYSAMPAPNLSYGRRSDINSQWGYLVNDSPGQTNRTEIAEQLLPEPVFSLESQILENTDQLTITLPDDCPADAQIYWTTDGCEPTEASRHDTLVLLPLTRSTVVRAKLMAPGYLRRPASVHSYLLPSQPHDVPVISLVTDATFLYDSEFGILSGDTNDTEANFMQKWRRPVYVETLGNDSMNLHQLCQTAVGGASSRIYSQKSLKLYANKRFGQKRLSGELWHDRPGKDKVKSLMLRNGGSRCMGSRINDAFVQTLFGQHLENLDWQAYEPVVLYINGQYQGIYELRERSDEDNIESHYGLSDDEIYQTSNIYQGPGNYNSLVLLAWSSSSTFQDFLQLLDIDEFINYLSAEAYAGNTDWPRNNIFAWTPREEGGRWRWLVKDLDQFRYYPDSCNFLNYIFLEGPEGEEVRANNFGGAHRIFSRLNQFNQFRQLFVDHLAVYLGDFLRPDHALPLFQTQRQQLQAELPLTFQTFGYNAAREWASIELDYLDDYIQRRPEQLYHNITDLYNLGNLIPLTIEGDSSSVTINDVPLVTHRFDGYWFTDHRLQLDAHNDTLSWRITITYPDSTMQVIDHELDTICLDLADYADATSLHLGLYFFDHSPIEIVRPDDLATDQRRRVDLWGRLFSPTSHSQWLIDNRKLRLSF